MASEYAKVSLTLPASLLERIKARVGDPMQPRQLTILSSAGPDVWSAVRNIDLTG